MGDRSSNANPAPRKRPRSLSLGRLIMASVFHILGDPEPPKNKSPPKHNNRPKTTTRKRKTPPRRPY